MIKKLLDQQKYSSFPGIRKARIICFFLACLFILFLLLGLVTFLGQIDNGIITTSLETYRGIKNLKYYFALSIFFLTVLLFVLYKFILEPIVEIIRANEEEQNRQIQQSKSILENTSDLIWAVDNEYRLLICNSAFNEMMEQETGQLPTIGENILKIRYSKLSFSKRKKLYDRALTGESFESEFEYTKNGRKRYHELSFQPLYAKDKSVTGCSVFLREITERMEIFQELQKNEEYLKEAQEIANVGHWNWDMVENQIQWSDQIYKVFELDAETFNANYEGMMNIIHPDDQEAFGNSIENCLTNQEPHDIIHRIVMGDGGIRYVHQKGKAYYIDDDTPVRMAGTIQDVTMLENARLQILRQFNELQNFVYIISHNVRAPIATLQSLVDLIEPGNNELNAEIIPSIGITVDTLDQTIKDLNYSLSLKNTQECTFEEVDLRKVLKDIERLIALDIDSSGAQIEYDFSETSKLFGIRSYYSNILFNLILNSINYKSYDRAPHIKVVCRTTPLGGIEILVSDNGIGMDLTKERYKKIFDMYGRLSGTSKGRGMGLYLAKTQVEAMNGTIDVESKPNKGSLFTLTFNGVPVSV